MSKKANPALIGGFVAGAVLLSVIGLLLFGRGSFFQDKTVCVMYFDESISGLDIGAPVEFQGVRVGTVTDVKIEFDQRQRGVVYRPVTIKIEGKRITFLEEDETGMDDDEYMDMLVDENGLRAQLASQSILTGKLKIELGYYPDYPVERKGKNQDLWEMPTIPSQLQRVAHELQQLPLHEIVSETHRAMKGLADIINSEEIPSALQHLNQTLRQLDGILAKLDASIEPLSGEFQATMSTASASLQDLDKVIVKIDEHIGPLLKNLVTASEKADKLMDERSPLQSDVAGLISDLRGLVKSLKQTSDYIEQHPESILRGKR